MKVDLGIGTLELGQGYRASTFIALGPLDVGAAASGMLTAAKAQDYKHHRVVAISSKDAEGHKLTMEVLRFALDDVKQKSRGKVANVKEIEKDGIPSIQGEIHHMMEKMPTVTFAYLTGVGGYVWSVMLTALDDKKSVAEARVDFEKLVGSLVLT